MSRLIHGVDCCVVVVVFVLTACVQNPSGWTSAQHDRSAADETTTNPAKRNDKAHNIRAGYGLPACHVGMPITTFGSAWSRPEGNEKSPIEYRRNASKGIDFNVKDNRVWNIFFYVKAQDGSASYPHGTDKGISRQSTQKDVRLAYGEPSYIGEARYGPLKVGDPARPIELTISYVELGIEFRFIGTELSLIRVSAPNEVFDYEHWQRLMGDWLIYLRPAEKRPHEKTAS